MDNVTKSKSKSLQFQLQFQLQRAIRELRYLTKETARIATQDIDNDNAQRERIEKILELIAELDETVLACEREYR